MLRNQKKLKRWSMDILVSPKDYKNGKSAAKAWIGQGSTTIESYRSWNTDEDKIYLIIYTKWVE